MSKGVFVTDEQVQLTGSPNVARFLAQCLYWSNNELVKSRQGWFYKSRTEWQAETWLSRYQQERARAFLRGSGLLKESRERTNLGVRLWFWLDLALYNRLINSLAEQGVVTVPESCSAELYDGSLTDEPETCSVNESAEQDVVVEVEVETADCPVELHDCSLTDESEITKNDDLEEDKEITESNSVEESKTIVPNTPIRESNKAEFSTNVSDNNKTIETEDSDIHCEAESDICLDLDAYQACHPFIYQFMKTRVLSGHQYAETLLAWFNQGGFSDEVLEVLKAFIDHQGHRIIQWYHTHTPVQIQPLSRADLQLAIWVSKG